MTASRGPISPAGFSATIASLAIAAAVSGGPDWEEGSQSTGDAGSLPPSAQMPKGQPPFTSLSSIHGGLDGLFAGGDYQDMYLIYIRFPSLFSAAVNCPVIEKRGGLNPQLWLFRESGLGLLGTDGIGDCASMGGSATDATGAVVDTPGLYYLAVSPFDSDPVSITGSIFDQAVAGEVSGPDGFGGSMPVIGWPSDGSSSGEYLVMLTGCAFPPCAGDTNADGEVDVDDLVEVITGWGPCPGPPTPCPGDVDGDGDVDVDDLVKVIGNWDACNPEV